MNDWDLLTAKPTFDRIAVGDAKLAPGNHVRLRPLGRADILDLVLDGRMATVESIEQDVEGRIYVAVTVDSDPGNDLGMQKLPGHRFFFGIDEVEPVSTEEEIGHG